MDKDLDLAALRGFRTVVRGGSCAAAARVLRVPKATLSKWVADPEADLGVRLIERTMRQIRATTEGKVLVQRAGQLLGDAEDIRRGFARDSPTSPSNTRSSSARRTCWKGVRRPHPHGPAGRQRRGRPADPAWKQGHRGRPRRRGNRDGRGHPPAARPGWPVERDVLSLPLPQSATARLRAFIAFLTADLRREHARLFAPQPPD